MKLQKLLVPVDFSLGSEMAFKYAKFLATKFSASIHVIHVVDKRYVEKIAEINGEPEDEVSDKLCSLANEKLDSFLIHNYAKGLIAGKKIRVGPLFRP